MKAGCAELLCAYIDVEPVTFNRGFYTVDVRYFYRITAHAFVGAARPVEVSGLAVFDKRVILFGSEGGAKVFSSDSHDCRPIPGKGLPTAVVESVDPIILGMKLVDVCPVPPLPLSLQRDPAPGVRLLLRRTGHQRRLSPPVRHPGPVLHHPPGAGRPAAHARLRLLHA